MGERRYGSFGSVYGDDRRDQGRREQPRQVQPPPMTDEERRAQDQYKLNRERICELFKYRDDLKQTFGPRGSEILEKCFNRIVTHTDARYLERRTDTQCGPECVEVATRALQAMLYEVTYNPVTPYMADMCMELSRLLFNWTSNMIQRQDLATQAATIQRIIRGHLTLLDCIDIIKKLTEQSKKVLEYTPPAFGLSQHYLNSLREEQEE